MSNLHSESHAAFDWLADLTHRQTCFMHCISPSCFDVVRLGVHLLQVLAEHLSRALTTSPRQELGVLLIAADGPVGGATSVFMSAVHSANSMGVGYRHSDGTSVQQGTNMMPRRRSRSANADARPFIEGLTSFGVRTQWAAGAGGAAK